MATRHNTRTTSVRLSPATEEAIRQLQAWLTENDPAGRPTTTTDVIHAAIHRWHAEVFGRES